MADSREKGQKKLQKFVVVVMGVVDLAFKYWSVSGNNAVINLGVSGGVEMSSWLVGLGLVGVLYWYIREKSFGLWMILVGGGVNIISRVVWGGVVDYWNLFGVLNNNLADYLVVGGVVVLVVKCRYGNQSNIRR